MTRISTDIEDLQRVTCRQYAAAFVPSPLNSKLGIALGTPGRAPINGLRHPVVGETNGWYLWFGEGFSEDPDFFSTVCAVHIIEQFPEVARLLGLPPGYRFLLAGDYADVWFDEKLLLV
jgi:hypothetical protein